MLKMKCCFAIFVLILTCDFCISQELVAIERGGDHSVGCETVKFTWRVPECLSLVDVEFIKRRQPNEWIIKLKGAASADDASDLVLNLSSLMLADLFKGSVLKFRDICPDGEIKNLSFDALVCREIWDPVKSALSEWLSGEFGKVVPKSRSLTERFNFEISRAKGLLPLKKAMIELGMNASFVGSWDMVLVKPSEFGSTWKNLSRLENLGLERPVTVVLILSAEQGLPVPPPEGRSGVK